MLTYDSDGGNGDGNDVGPGDCLVMMFVWLDSKQSVRLAHVLVCCLEPAFASYPFPILKFMCTRFKEKWTVGCTLHGGYFSNDSSHCEFTMFES